MRIIVSIALLATSALAWGAGLNQEQQAVCDLLGQTGPFVLVYDSKGLDLGSWEMPDECLDGSGGFMDDFWEDPFGDGGGSGGGDGGGGGGDGDDDDDQSQSEDCLSCSADWSSRWTPYVERCVSEAKEICDDIYTPNSTDWSSCVQQVGHGALPGCIEEANEVYPKHHCDPFCGSSEPLPRESCEYNDDLGREASCFVTAGVTVVELDPPQSDLEPMRSVPTLQMR